MFCMLMVHVSCYFRELRERLQPEVAELIKQQRLNRLCEGSCFKKISARRRQGETLLPLNKHTSSLPDKKRSDQTFAMVSNTHVLMAKVKYITVAVFSFFNSISDRFLYCRLSPNHKVLHYRDVEDLSQGQIPHESLQEKCKPLVHYLCI